jgi:hypothetical protein
MESAGEAAVRRRGFGPFVTLVESERPGEVLERWESRRHRKQVGKDAGGSTWWAPRARGWWIGILFAVGSILFALGAVPGYASAVGITTDAVTFFVGSLFFTTAGFLQYREVVDSGPDGPPRGWRRVLTYSPSRIDWWATAIQLVGTIFFNVSTGNAMRLDLTAQAARHHVWRPDVFGSACFLVASALAWFEVSHGWGSWQPKSISWWIPFANLIGSVAFGVSAVAAYVVPDTGKLLDVELSNLGTFVGALCFLGGALLLLPERTLPPLPAVGAVAATPGVPRA